MEFYLNLPSYLRILLIYVWFFWGRKIFIMRTLFPSHNNLMTYLPRYVSKKRKKKNAQTCSARWTAQLADTIWLGREEGSTLPLQQQCLQISWGRDQGGGNLGKGNTRIPGWKAVYVVCFYKDLCPHTGLFVIPSHQTFNHYIKLIPIVVKF
jgi:hypothetical protein